jgi:hypothetical protein
MTEAEWLACPSAMKMLPFLRERASNRKLRLFACACCRRIWSLLVDERSRRAVEVLERYVDGEATKQELGAAQGAAALAVGQWHCRHRRSPEEHRLGDAAEAAKRAARPSDHKASLHETVRHAISCARSAEHRRTGFSLEPNLFQASVLRCVLGSLLFRPVLVLPDWRTPTVLALAQGIYHDHATDRHPILGDALEDAGCTDLDILGHCRGSGEHYRGCWVIDLLLGKE